MKRVLGVCVGFILIFGAAFFGAKQWLSQCPVSGKQLYCCAQAGLYKKLGIAADQQTKILTLDKEFLKEKNRLCMELCQTRYTIAKLLREPATQQTQVDAKIAEVAAIQLAMERQSVAHVLKVRDALMPEQAKKYMEDFYQDICGGIKAAACGFLLEEERS